MDTTLYPKCSRLRKGNAAAYKAALDEMAEKNLTELHKDFEQCVKYKCYWRILGYETSEKITDKSDFEKRNRYFQLPLTKKLGPESSPERREFNGWVLAFKQDKNWD